VLVHLVNDDDVLVRAARGRPGLDQEAGGELGRVGGQELERHLAAELEIARDHHPGHAAAAELADDLVVLQPRAGPRLRRAMHGSPVRTRLAVDGGVEEPVLVGPGEGILWPCEPGTAACEVALVSLVRRVAHDRLRRYR
jgi:hypothetical protein